MTLARPMRARSRPSGWYPGFSQREDLVGIYVAGGGISGVLKALRDVSAERRQRVRVVCRDIGPETRKGLAEGLITAALCHPLEQTSAQLVQTMLDAMQPVHNGVILQRTLPFEIITPKVFSVEEFPISYHCRPSKSSQGRPAPRHRDTSLKGSPIR